MIKANETPLTREEIDKYRELFNETPCYINMTCELQKNVNVQVRRAIAGERGRLTRTSGSI
ncbi:hypothetical protein JCM39068_40840 [Desulfocastanea catecholica]